MSSTRTGGESNLAAVFKHAERGGLLVLIVWAAVRIFPERRGGERSEFRGRSSEEILRERFARGETGAEEYERSLSVLSEREVP